MMHLMLALKRAVLAPLVLLLGLMAAWTARAENVFFIAPTSPADGIYSVDIITGGPPTRIVSLVGGQYNATLATRPSDGMLFWLDADTVPPNLWMWDPTNPSTAPVILGSPGAITAVVRLAFDGSGRLLAMDRSSSNLWILSTTNGSIQGTIPLFGDVPAGVPGGDLCLDPIIGTLYLTVNTDLYTVSNIGEIVYLGPITGLQGATPSNFAITGCAVTVNGTLIVSQNGQPRLSSVNPVTRVATPLSSVTGTGATNIGDLSSAPTALSSDIAVGKVTANATPGATVPFTVTVTNNGPSKATDVRVYDPTPAGLTLISATPSVGTYYPVDTTVGVNTFTAGTWRIGALSIGQSATLNLNYTVNVGTPVTNTASVSYNDMYDPTPGNNTASATATPSFDLQLAKAALTGIGIGTNAQYQLTVSNSGRVPTSGGIAVTDVLPTGMTFVSGTGTGWTCGAVGQTVTCNSSDVIAANGTGNPITLTVAVGAATSQPNVTNTASVSGVNEPPSNNGNNQASVTSPVCPAACVDLTPVKTVSASPMTVGVQATYTISIRNLGGVATSSGYSFTDTLPAGLTLAAAPTAGGGWTCPAAQNAVGGTQVQCNSSTAIPANSTSTTVSFPVNVAVGAYPSVTNSVTVSNGGDTFAGNNTVTLTTPVVAADLTVTKETVASLSAASSNSYRITVQNVGAGASTGTTTVNDTMPANVTMSAAPTVTALNGSTVVTWNCTTTGPAGAFTAFSCPTNGSLAPGSQYLITVPVNAVPAAVTNSPTVSNTATVNNANEPPSLGGNNTSSVTDTADLIIRKTHSNPFLQNNVSLYGISVANIGTVAIGGTTRVTDTLPAGMTLAAVPSGTLQILSTVDFVTVVGTVSWNCPANNPSAGANTVGGSVVSCTLTATGTGTTIIAPGGATPTLQVRVNPTNVGSFTNTATVTNTVEPGGNATNNSVNDPTTVVVGPSWTKTFTPNNLVAGEPTTLTITITRGAAPALTGLSFGDTFPAGMTITSTPSVNNTCGGTVTANAGDKGIVLSNGSLSGTSCVVSVQVSQTGVGPVTNTTGPLSTSVGTVGPVSATLTTTAPTNVKLTKVTAPNPIAAGGKSVLTFTLTNKNTATNNVGFTDTLPTGMVAYGTPTFTLSSTTACGTGVTTTYQTTTPAVVVSGVNLAANGTCQISIPVTANSAGSYANTGTNVTGTSPAALDKTRVNDTLVVQQGTLSKAFLPTAVQPSTPSTLTFTITNAASQPYLSPLAFTETLPTGLVLAAVPATPQCGGDITGTVGGNTITVANAGIVASQANCTITAQVQSATTGLYANTSARITGLSTSLVNNVNANLAVFSTPSVTKTVAVLNDPFNGTTSPKAIPGAEMEYTITFNNGSATTVDNNSIVITDTVPPNTSLFVGSVGPVTSFSAPGLSALTAADITYSNSPSAPYSFTYTPVPVGGYDPAITAFQVNPKGTMSANSLGTLKFKVKVR